jgi:hypothetical protein
LSCSLKMVLKLMLIIFPKSLNQKF